MWRNLLQMWRYLLPLGIFIVLVIFLSVGLKLNPRDVPSPLIGKPAPEFSLPELHQPEQTVSPADYKGRDMVSAHKGMNLNEEHLVAAIDDVLEVLDEGGIDPLSRAEVLAILYSFKGEVLFQ